MNQGVDLDNLTRVARKREFDDGLMDFALAISFLALGMISSFFLSPSGIRWYQSALGNHRTLILLGEVLFLVILFIVIRGGGRVIEYIRIKTILRDRGIVKPMRRYVGWRTTILAVVVFLAMIVGAAFLMAIGRIGIEFVLRTLVASSGLGSGIMYLGMGVSLGLRRFLIVGVMGGVLSVAILVTSVSFSFAWLLLGIIWAIVLSVSGFWGLRKALSMAKESRHE